MKTQTVINWGLAILVACLLMANHSAMKWRDKAMKQMEVLQGVAAMALDAERDRYQPEHPSVMLNYLWEHGVYADRYWLEESPPNGKSAHLAAMEEEEDFVIPYHDLGDGSGNIYRFYEFEVE